MSAIYDLIFSIPVCVYTVILIYPAKDASAVCPAAYVAAIASIFVAALYHLRTKQRILLAGVVVAAASGTVLSGKGELISDNLWVINVLLISVASFVLIKISGYNRYVKPGIAAAGVLVSVIRMVAGHTDGKAAFCMVAIFLLSVLAELIQKGWKKEGDTGIKEHVVFVFPFLLPAIIMTCLAKIPAKPYDWHHVRDLADGIRNGFEAVLQALSPEDGWDGDDMGFSERAAIGGKVGGDPYSVMTVSEDAAGDYRLYLSGKTFDTFDGRKWVKEDNSDMNYASYDLIETTAAVIGHEEHRTEDYLKSGRIRIKYEGMRTKHMFVPPKAVIVKSDDTELVGGDISLARGRKGDYTLKYYRLNRDDPGFISMAKEEIPVGEDAWREALKYNTSFSSEHLAYNDYRVYREKIYDIYASPVELSERCTVFVNELLEGADSDYEKLERIEKLLSSFNYSTSPGDLPETVQSDADYEDYFLFDKKEGYCTHFATAFVILARSCGIPARYVQGYSVLSKAAGFEVLSDRTHAWPEAYIDGVGWLIFEPTPGYRQVMGWDIATGSNGPVIPEEDIKTDNEEIEQEPDEDVVDDVTGRWIRLSLVIFAIFLTIFIITDRVIRRIRYKNMDDREKVIMLCKKNMRMLRLIGARPEGGETLAEFSQRAGQSVPAEVLMFIDLYESALYAPEAVTAGSAPLAEEYAKKCSEYVRRTFFRAIIKKTEKKSKKV